MRAIRCFATLGALALVMLIAAPAQAADWERLGSRKVKFRGEKDAIPVTGAKGRYTALKLKVDGGNLELYNLKVTFGDGTSWSPKTRLVFRQGSRSRTIDLPGGRRVIRKVEFWYRSKLNRGRATITAYGRH